MEETETTLHVGQTVIQQLKKYKRSVSWLAKEIGYDRSSLNVLLKEQKDIHPTLLRRIAKAMNIDFFILYSNDFQAQQKKRGQIPLKM